MNIQLSRRVISRSLLLALLAATLLGGKSQPAAAQDYYCAVRFCFKAPHVYATNYFRFNFNRRDVLISGVNFNHPVDTTDSATSVLFALRTRGTSPQQLFNKHYVAAQLTLARDPMPTVITGMASTLGCFLPTFDPMELSNGFVLQPETRLGQFFDQCFVVGSQPPSAERDADMTALVTLLAQLNTCR
jgi:hypothetical protein